jgi:hypothetical protein
MILRRSRQHVYSQLAVHSDGGSPKYEKAAMRWLERYLTEGTPRLQHFAEITASLAQREP